MYATISEDEDIESNEEVREINHMVIQATLVTKDKPYDEKVKAKKMKPKKPSMSIEEVERGVIKDGNLKPLCEVYGTFVLLVRESLRSLQ